MRCMQESTIKFNLAYMRLLCGLLLLSIIDYCLLSDFLSSGSLSFLLQLLFFNFVQTDTNKTYRFSFNISRLFFDQL